jgi:hypothetical protein
MVGAVGLGGYAALDRRWEARGSALPPRGAAALPWGAALWLAVAAFDLTIAFAIGETRLGCAGLAIAGVVVAAWVARRTTAPPGRAARAWHVETLHP